MGLYRSSSHVYWRCKYHIVWTPKYRFRILKDKLGKELYRTIYILCGIKGCEVLELNVQPDHVHLVVIVPPKISISTLMGHLKGRSAIRLYNRFPHIRKKLWGNHFWSRGYFVDWPLYGLAPIFPYTFYHLTHYWFAAADIPVANDTPVHYADAIRCNVRRPPQGSLPLLTRRVSA